MVQVEHNLKYIRMKFIYIYTYDDKTGRAKLCFDNLNMISTAARYKPQMQAGIKYFITNMISKKM